jgi:hypothetical protein
MRTPSLNIFHGISLVAALAAVTASAQIDPDARQLLHLGVNVPLKGNGPVGAYAFYYWNMPNMPSTNIFLRLAIAPTYVDSELGFKGLISENTDLAVGAYGGAFANSYQEVRGGVYMKDESFDGLSAGTSVSIYHLFNPSGMIPLTGILRQSVTYNSWTSTSKTANNFDLPDNQPILTTRAGFRWGGKEPVLMPTLAMEVSGWYELDKRTDASSYGFDHDRPLNNIPQRVFGRAKVALTTLKWGHYISGGILGGAAFDSDRLSCFRLGGVLPYTKEFPLQIPGYYYQELSAQDFGLAYARYAIPLDHQRSFYAIFNSAVALVKYEEGLGQPGAFNSGVGGGVAYSAPSGRWKALTQYGYGFQAERSNGRGGMSLAFAFQYNFGKTKLASDEAYEQWQKGEENQKGTSYH